MSNCCVICYEVSDPPLSSNTKIKVENNDQFDNDGTRQKEQDKLKRFFKLLGKHLEEPGHGGSSFKLKWFQILLEQLLNKGDFLPCEKCSEVVHSFCQLYQQLKRIEVKLNGKLSVLSEILKEVEETPERVKGFQRRVKQLELEASLPNSLNVNGNELVLSKEISSFRSDLLYKCERKLSLATVPKVKLCNDKKHQPLKEEDNQLSGEIKRNLEVVNVLDDKGSGGLQKDTLEVASPPALELQIGPSYSLASNVKVEQNDYELAAAGLELEVDEGNNNTTTIIENEIFMEETEQVKVETELGDDVELDPLSLDGDPLACETEFDAQIPEMMEHEEANNFNETMEQDPSQSAPVIKSILYCTDGEAAIVSPRLRTVHPCPKCSKLFATPKSLMKHQRLHHGNKALIQCEQCGKVFKWESRYKDHLTSHLTEVKEKCAVCGKSLKTIKSLKKHLRDVHQRQDLADELFNV